MCLNKDLSEREKSLLFKMCEQKTTKEISSEMGLRKRTIDKARTELMRKTESKSMVGLVIYAIENSVYKLNHPVINCKI